jgi:hypothetical protein
VSEKYAFFRDSRHQEGTTESNTQFPSITEWFRGNLRGYSVSLPSIATDRRSSAFNNIIIVNLAEMQTEAQKKLTTPENGEL